MNDHKYVADYIAAITDSRLDMLERRPTSAMVAPAVSALATLYRMRPEAAEARVVRFRVLAIAAGERF